MSWFSRLFGGGSGEGPTTSAPTPEEYKGFHITPTPIREGGQYRIAARIEKDGRSHDLIRADTTGSLEEATTMSLGKAKQVIDEQGERVFG